MVLQYFPEGYRSVSIIYPVTLYTKPNRQIFTASLAALLMTDRKQNFMVFEKSNDTISATFDLFVKESGVSILFSWHDDSSLGYGNFGKK